MLILNHLTQIALPASKNESAPELMRLMYFIEIRCAGNKKTAEKLTQAEEFRTLTWQVQ